MVTTTEITLSEEQEARAARLHQESLVVNALTLTHTATEKRWFDEMRRGGTDVMWVTLGGENLRETIFAAADALRFIDAHRDVAAQVTTAAEMRQARAAGKLGILFNTQNCACLEGDYALLAALHRLGYRSMGITYSEGNILGDGCGELTREVRGLSFFGADVVKEMNRLGIIPDVSHCGDATIRDVLKVSSSAVICTHSNVRAIADTTRNRTDEQIRGIAASGGVIGITPLPRMINNDPRAATLDGMLDHIEHIVHLVGADYVGIGTDFTDAVARVKAGEIAPRRARRTFYAGGAVWRERRPEMLGTTDDWATVPYARGFESGSQTPNLTRGLVARGYDDESIAKILGGNWLRVLGQVCG
ncbi:MAG: membrane dipeptidase [Chloroflexi bacterium]|nr:membrane dipeptidase [Chloroflexota bacterium]